MAASGLLIFGIIFGFSSVVHAECGIHDSICVFHFEIEHRLTMMRNKDLVFPENGRLYKYDVTNTSAAEPIPADNVIIGDGWEDPRLVTVVNGRLPGPSVIVYEGQTVTVYVTNKLNSGTASIHWHGLHQQGTPWMDGVPWVTQCPILPGQTFKYEFIAKPKGTFWWHSHSGAERSMGVFGAFIIKSRVETKVEEHIVQIQDWNHNVISDTVHMKMVYGAYEGRTKVKGKQSLDGSFFSIFQIHSGLINGRGRYYDPRTGISNMAPLTVYRVLKDRKYRFRVIGTGSLYPFRISVDKHPLKIIASDGYDLEPVVAESFIINPGERFDFEITADQPVDNYWIRAITIEKDNYHRVEAILRYERAKLEEPTTSRQMCTASNPCIVVNCPFTYYPLEHTVCRTFDHLKSLSEDDPAPPYRPGRFQEHFLNFAFPGITSYPGSVNGRVFDTPTVNPLTQPKEWYSPCEAPACGDGKHCKCTYALSIGNRDTIQMVFMNVGRGRGWAHPIHMHGHSFYVIKMGYGQYDSVTGAIGNDSIDIDCRGDPVLNFCNNATWANKTWLHGNIPGIELARPPRKDTIIVPSGGYVVVRIRADNPGLWNMHCHIELHNLDGMQMLLNESFNEVTRPPKGFPECHLYPPHPRRTGYIVSDDNHSSNKGNFIIYLAVKSWNFPV